MRKANYFYDKAFALSAIYAREISKLEKNAESSFVALKQSCSLLCIFFHST